MLAISQVQTSREGNLQSWCDKLASTPTAGFKLDAHVVSGDSMLDCLTPILNREVTSEKYTFNIERHESLGFSFNTESGYRYGVDPTSVHVGFNHRLRAIPISGGPPELEMLSTPAPFTELLPKVFERLIEATLMQPATQSRKVRRLGIVSLTSVGEEDLPPGIARFIEYVGRPWGGELDHYSINVSSIIQTGDGWSDSCIHTITKPQDDSALMTLQFDWGRTFEPGRPITSGALTNIVQTCQAAALAYFEELAEGSLFDEQLIVDAAQV